MREGPSEPVYRSWLQTTLSCSGQMFRVVSVNCAAKLQRRWREALRKWVQEQYPSIAKEAKQLGAEIWFGDESGLRSDYHAGTTWGRKGETPVVRSTGARFRLNMLSAVNRRGRMRFMVEKKGLNADVVCKFLNRLMVGTTKHVFLICDGHPIHKSAKVAETVRSYNGTLRLFLLPRYSPELNPGEGVWREVKAHRLGRAGVFSSLEMKSKALGALRHLARRPDKIRSFFRRKSTMYAS